ncbi:MAG: tetratricopeptide repeat protein [Desulfobacterales bacterium]|nr:tetratricopeptide repeat protein [Desulfobacterales bacterium]
MMKNLWCPWGAILFLCVALLAGCSTSSATKSSARTAEGSIQPNAFYYYTEAQLLRDQGEGQAALEFMQKAMALDPDSRLLKRETAVLYLQLKDDEAALALLEALLEEQPDDVEALNLVGRLLQSRKQHERAKGIYARILAQDPDNQDIYLLLGNLYIEDAQWDEAYDLFSRFVQRFPNAYAGYFFLGKVYRQRNQPLEAEKAFRRSLAIEPELEGARFELIELYTTELTSGQYQEKAVQLYEELLQENPQNNRALFGYALFLRDSGREAKAEEILRARASDISQNDLIRGIYRFYIEPERYRDAIFLLTPLIALHPDYIDLHYLLGVSFNGLNDSARALTAFRSVSPSSRFYGEATLQIASRHAEEDRFDQAIAHLEAALAKQPANTEFLLYLGYYYEEAERFEEAERYLLRVIEAVPDSEQAHFRLGVVYDKMKRKEDSIAAMQRVIAINGDHANALNYLGYTYADMGINLDEAEALIRRALELRPDDGYITDSLGWVFYKKGNYEEALKWLLKASELVPDDPVISEHVGDAYLKLGDKANALIYYLKSLSLRKEDSERQKIQPKIDALKREGI